MDSRAVSRGENRAGGSRTLYAITHPPDAERNGWHWAGWRHRYWPANVIQPGLQLYGFDLKTRRFFVRLKVTRGGTFEYTTWRDFSQKVKKLTGWVPNGRADYRARMPEGTRAHPCTGIAFRWTVVSREEIAAEQVAGWTGRFPQLGWFRSGEHLSGQEPLSLGTVKPDRRVVTLKRIIRDSVITRQLKVLHSCACQLCGTTLRLADGRGYAEGHHIRPLAGKHRGPDTPDNVLVLCPNCHALCDLGAILLKHSRIREAPGHTVGSNFLAYHNTHIFKRVV